MVNTIALGENTDIVTKDRVLVGAIKVIKDSIVRNAFQNIICKALYVIRKVILWHLIVSFTYHSSHCNYFYYYNIHRKLSERLLKPWNMRLFQWTMYMLFK